MGLSANGGFDLHHKSKNGKLNKITDVPGVKVAHVTIKDGEINTGVTAILPHEGNLFRDKPAAGAAVLNGFGKSMGIIQLEELGCLETPIIMTNTLSVGTAATALTKYMLERNKDIGVDTGTVNCLVTECNDGRLNDIRGLHVTEEHVLEALAKAEAADADFDEGAVGGGTGMCCLGFKGGIGSASKLVKIGEKTFTVGSIVMSNFGGAGNLVIGGRHIGEELEPERLKRESADKGSIIMITATDIPMTSRQLTRVARRAAVALGRTGSIMGNGSGDISIAFSTANRMPHYLEGDEFVRIAALHEDSIDKVFTAAIDATEEAIISSLWHAETTKGVRGNVYYGLRDFL